MWLRVPPLDSGQRQPLRRGKRFRRARSLPREERKRTKTKPETRCAGGSERLKGSRISSPRHTTRYRKSLSERGHGSSIAAGSNACPGMLAQITRCTVHITRQRLRCMYASWWRAWSGFLVKQGPQGPKFDTSQGSGSESSTSTGSRRTSGADSERRALLGRAQPAGVRARSAAKQARWWYGAVTRGRRGRGA